MARRVPGLVILAAAAALLIAALRCSSSVAAPQPLAFSPASRLLGFLRRAAGRPGGAAKGVQAPLGPPRRLPRAAAADEEGPINGAALPTDLLEPPPAKVPEADAAKRAQAAEAKVKKAKEAFQAEVQAFQEETETAKTAVKAAMKKKAAKKAEEAAGGAASKSGLSAWAASLNAVADEAEAQQDSEDLGARLSSKVTMTVARGSASGLAAAADWPIWVPFAAAATFAAAFALATSVNLKPPAPPAATPSPAPIVVQVQEKPAPAPKPAAPKPPAPKPPAPVAVAPAPVAVAPAPAPKPAPAPAPKPAPAPAPAAKLAPTPTVAPAPAVAATEKSAAAAGPSWGRRFAAVLADGLRIAADKLPEAELAIEKEMPEVQKGVQWALEIRPENAQSKVEEALPVIGKAVAKGAEAAARTGLQVSSAGLEFVAEELPEAGDVLQGAVVKALPSIQAGTKATANASRQLADKAGELSQRLPSKVPKELGKVLGEAEPILDTAAVALDAAADAAPGAEAFAAYVAGKAMPIVRATLSAVSEIAGDAAKLPLPEKVPLPEASQVKGTLKSFGIDTDELAKATQAKAQNFWRESTAKLPDPGKAFDKAVRDVLGEPAGSTAAAAPAKVSAPAPSPAPLAAAVKVSAPAPSPAPAAAAVKASAPAPGPAAAAPAPAAVKADAPAAAPAAPAAAAKAVAP